MTSLPRPGDKPADSRFSSGPCKKRPGWSLAALADATLGRSHRAPAAKAKLKRAIDLTREVLQVPADYRIGIVPASDTGAVEMAMWSMLGPRGVDVLGWEAFGEVWVVDAAEELRLADVRTEVAPYGVLPDLSRVDARTRDVVFTWNGTAAGVRIPNADWIPADREGLTICDATSAAFAMPLDWSKLDVVTFSWQKVMGGEAAHGMLILGPRAVERLLTYEPDRALPKIFRMVSKGRLIEGIFSGDTINTPSMLCVEDYLDTLHWAQSIGGLDALIARTSASAKALHDWVARTPWVDHLAADPATRSTTGVCLSIVDPEIISRGPAAVAEVAKTIVSILEKEGIATDIGAYRDAPPGLRIWCGATVEPADVVALTPWLDWAFAQAREALPKAA